ncbi:MAG: nucleotidyltransferase family protein [Thermodesulfobacteriota bacterium]|nr:nucleotidyltransferase family protein [Thermodesulfobacteriota bacterium]
MAWKREDRLLLKLLFGEACRDILLQFSPGSLDWDYIVETATSEGVAAALFYKIKKSNLEEMMPAETCQYLQRLYNSNLMKNMYALGELKEILSRFKDEGIPFIMLKGIALAEHIYPVIAMRGMSDIDILVKKDSLQKVDKCLSSFGYFPRDSSAARAVNNPAGYLASLDYRRDMSSLSLHIHWHLVNSSVPAYMFASQIDMERIWKMSVPAMIADVESRILSPSYLIIYLCEHALRIGHSFDRLILIYDIFQSIKVYEKSIDWDFIIRESRDFNLSRLLYFSLTIVRDYSSLSILDKVINSLRPSHITIGERFFLFLQLFNNRIRGSSYLIYLTLNRGFINKCRFLFRTFFPPPHILFQRQYDKNSEFRESYYLFRIYEVVRYIATALFYVIMKKARGRDMQ